MDENNQHERQTSDEEKNRKNGEEKSTGTKPEESEAKPMTSDERMQRKIICSLSYLFGILFFLPLIVYPEDPFARFHANQSLVILLTVVIGEVIFGILGVIPGVGFVFGILCGVFGLIMLVGCILAILGVVREEKYELPVLGKIRLIK